MVAIMLTERALLRLHVEAVWYVRLPPLVHNEHDLLPTSSLPAWKLCVAQLTDERIHLWRPDVSGTEREALRLRVDEALAFPLLGDLIAGVSREVAFSLLASPKIAVDAARRIARPMTIQDRALIAGFDSGALADFAHPELHPFMGVVDAGRLLCLAHSARRTTDACELGIDTLPEARRRGYALAATVVWTQAIVQEGLVPLYSALAENSASLNLAAAAGYRAFARAATLE